MDFEHKSEEEQSFDLVSAKNGSRFPQFREVDPFTVLRLQEIIDTLRKSHSHLNFEQLATLSVFWYLSNSSDIVVPRPRPIVNDWLPEFDVETHKIETLAKLLCVMRERCNKAYFRVMTETQIATFFSEVQNFVAYAYVRREPMGSDVYSSAQKDKENFTMLSDDFDRLIVELMKSLERKAVYQLKFSHDGQYSHYAILIRNALHHVTAEGIISGRSEAADSYKVFKHLNGQITDIQLSGLTTLSLEEVDSVFGKTRGTRNPLAFAVMMQRHILTDVYASAINESVTTPSS